MLFFATRLQFLLPFILALSTGAIASETAVLAPDRTETSRKFAAALEATLKQSHTVTDSELASAALRARNPESAYNLNARDARLLGSAIGCRFYVLVRGDTLRRSSFERKQFYEAFSAVYLIDARSGELILWRLFNSEQNEASAALESLSMLAPTAATMIVDKIDARIRNTTREKQSDETTLIGDAEPDVRLPLPYRRIKPEYTRTADYYGVEATVDIEVTIDSEGNVTSTRIVRWAGFGLDESVDKTVREMNWRAADRKGKTLAMTVLLRYNFKDLENRELPR